MVSLVPPSQMSVQCGIVSAVSHMPRLLGIWHSAICMMAKNSWNRSVHRSLLIYVSLPTLPTEGKLNISHFSWLKVGGRLGSLVAQKMGELEVLLWSHISLSEWQGLVANLGHSLELRKKLTKIEILAITID